MPRSPRRRRRAGYTLHGTTPGWLSQANNLGATPSTQPVQFGVLLNMRDQAGAEAKLQAISDPTSASYGQWLSNAAFNAELCPEQRRRLRRAGLAALAGLQGHQDIAERDVRRGQRFGGAGRADLRLPGQQLLLPGQDRASEHHGAVPAGEHAGSGQQRDRRGGRYRPGLDPEAARRHRCPGPPGRRYGVQPCSDYYGQKTAYDKPTAYGKHEPYVICGYVPQQYQSAYGESSLLASGVNGRGVTVAITDAYAAPTIYQDAQIYNQVHHQPQFTRGQFSQITPGPNGYANDG